MKILFIAPYVPSPIRVRPYNLIRGLTGEGHLLHVAAQAAGARDREDADSLSRLENVSVKAVNLSAWRPPANCALAMLKREPLWVAYGRNPHFSETVRQSLEENDYAVIHVEHVRSLFLLPLLLETRKKRPRPAMIFDAVDCISGLLAQYAERSTTGFRRLLYRLEAARMREFEPNAARLFDRVIITSESEREALAELMGQDGKRVEVVPNGVDLDYFQPSQEAPEEETLIFSGRMSFYNNAEAAQYFIREIFPLIKAQRPGARLILAGADPPSELQRLGKEADIEVTGYVEDLRPYLRRASLVICPMLTAVGVQNKVLEAMAMAKPVVATSLVCRAFSAQEGKEIIVADGKSQFAGAVVELLRRPDFARQIGKCARAYVERVHRWAESARRLADLYTSAIGGTRER